MEKKEKIKNEIKNENENDSVSSASCTDSRCPFHGKIKVHDRVFRGKVRKIVGKRAAIVFERLVYIRKYERYLKKKTVLHAHIPDCIKVGVGDIVEVRGCRPLSKITHFIIIKRIKNKE